MKPICVDCGKELVDYRSKRCNPCSAKHKHKGGVEGFGFRVGRKHTGHLWEKGDLNIPSNKGKEVSEEVKEKMRTAKDGHHIWYEDNEGGPTDKGKWYIQKSHHAKIHHLLRRNLWTDNRRFLAG